MAIRPAVREDAQEIAALVLLAIEGIANQLTGYELIEDVLAQLIRFYEIEGNRFSSVCFQVLEVDGRIAGMILCYHGSQEVMLNEPIIAHLRSLNSNSSPVIDKEADNDEYYIDALAINPDYQGQGLGKLLIAAAEEKATSLGYPRIALNVDQDNTGAHRLYSKLGYQANKVIKINGKPFWHMVKKL